MISEPVCVVRCDGPESAPAECRASRVVVMRWGIQREHAAEFFNALFRDWLAEPQRVRCPLCLAVDGKERA